MTFLSLFGIANAYAQTAGARPSAGQGFMSMLPMLVILIAFMYFLIIRPQSKRAKEHRELIANLQKGDEIVTSGGLLGKINKISDNFISLEIADKVEITIQKSSIGASVPKGTMKSV
jgi:preprotein translocase subunit YajC